MLKDLLGQRPDAFSKEEWAVVHASLNPDRLCHYSPKHSEWRKYRLSVRARNCFPGLPSHEALAAFREALQKPHVSNFIADFRAIECLDMLESREILRRATHTVLAMERFLRSDDEVRGDRKGSASIAKEICNAAKVLSELDDLQVVRNPVTPSMPMGAASNEDLEANVDVILADLEARKESE